MLRALNLTLHTRNVNATLSAFQDNWCDASCNPEILFWT